MDLESLLASLTSKRPVFHSEADFQHALAWEIQQQYPDASVRLEYRPAKVKARIYMDIWVVLGDKKMAIELKYKTKAVETVHQDEVFTLLDQKAHDCGRYDFLKDIMRLEHVVQKEPDTVGYAVLVTNDPAYWSEALSDTVDSAFRLQEGKVLNGELAWGGEASAGTMRGREKPVKLRDRYQVEWKPFSIVDSAKGVFRSLTFKIEPRKQLDIDGFIDQFAARKPLFHSQADFRDALTDYLKSTGFHCKQNRIIGAGYQTTDVYAEQDGQGAYAIEVRYKTTQLHVIKDDVVYDLKSQGAQDTGRYDFISDIVKLEQASDDSPGLTGYAILITNDHLYWEEPKRASTVDERFRIHHGARLRGELSWSPEAGEGTMENREKSLVLKGSYKLEWKHYSMPSPKREGRFKILVVRVGR
ncbi:hypothetical protein [Paenibacillus sp. MBLB4367]|uniref:hypothetical protein n=1 Tax=Paenibacillus sp. MBLB4367 TaxID=3384767 RepID=UPI003907F5A4